VAGRPGRKLFRRCGILVKWLKQANKDKGSSPALRQVDIVNFSTMHFSNGLGFSVVTEVLVFLRLQ